MPLNGNGDDREGKEDDSALPVDGSLREASRGLPEGGINGGPDGLNGKGPETDREWGGSTPGNRKGKRGKPPRGWKRKFIEAMSRTANIRVACEYAGVGRSIANRHKKIDPVFSEAWELAIEDAVDSMEAEAMRRGARGYEEPVFHKGAIVGHVRKASDQLLMFMLKGYRPERFRDNYQAPASLPPSPVPSITVNLNGRPLESGETWETGPDAIDGNGTEPDRERRALGRD